VGDVGLRKVEVWYPIFNTYHYGGALIIDKTKD